MKALWNSITDKFSKDVEFGPYDLQQKVAYDNMDIVEPQGELWCRFTVRPGASIPLELGPQGTDRQVGDAFAQLYFPLSTGLGDVLEIAQSIRDLFNRKTTTAGVSFQTCSVQNIGEIQNSYLVTVTIPFFFDEVRV